MPRTLLVMRHAKSAWGSGLPDHERPLNGRGRRDALAAGGVLRERRIGLVLCSSATRTRESWARAQRGGARADRLLVEPRVYAAGVSRLLSLVRDVDDAVDTALLLGHVPGVEDLVHELAERDAHPGWRLLEEKFATATIATLSFEGPWRKLAPGAARLQDCAVPRG